MQAEFHPPSFDDAPRAGRDPRKFRYGLRRMAAQILKTGHRTASCGHRLVGAQAALVMGDRGAYVAGVETCGSVWACPVCAGKIAEGRRKDVARCLSAHDRLGGHVYMAAFTVPHYQGESCHTLRAFVAATWRKLISGKAWKTAKRRFGIVGSIRALEVTHTQRNGWHPHLHVIFLTNPLSDMQSALFSTWLRDRWIAIVGRTSQRADLPRDRANMLRRAVHFARAEGVRVAGDYVCKWGVDAELCKAVVKVSKHGGRSPWQLLADAEAGDHYARMLFREYAVSFKGARQLTWSLGLRDLYDLTPELSDYELAKMDAPQNGDAVVGVLRRGVWIRVVTAGLVPDVLNAIEADGWPGVLRLLRANALALPEATDHDDRDPEAPCQTSRFDLFNYPA